MRKPSNREAGILAALAVSAGLAANEVLKPDLSPEDASLNSEGTAPNRKKQRERNPVAGTQPPYQEDAPIASPLPMSEEDRQRMSEHLPLRDKLENDLIQQLDPKFLEIVQFGHVTSRGSSTGEQQQVYDEGISIQIQTASGNVRSLGTFTPDSTNERITFDPNMELDQAIFFATGKHLSTMDLGPQELDIINTLVEELDPVLDLLDQQREARQQEHPEDVNPYLDQDIRRVLENSTILTDN